MSEALEARIRAWMAADVDEADRTEIQALLDETRVDPGNATWRELESRFSGRLRFGTAGLRGRIGAGESRMNRATVIRATAGLADALVAAVPDAKAKGVVLGRDARHGSEAFQRDAAEVLLAKGFRVIWLPEPGPTPLVPFGVKRLGASAGIMVTASHNPPQDNGYKVYWAHGAQISSPIDAQISDAIDAQPGANQVARLVFDAAEGRFEPRPDLVDAYLDMLDRLRLVPEAPVERLSVVYTAMHGVGGATFLRAFERRGLTDVTVVPEQQAPDPDFPTVRFPNPEEDGALDLAQALAEERSVDLVLANDPDADRLAALVRNSDGSWRNLSGNDIGVLLARHLIDHDEPGDGSRLVVNTVVSSRLLGRMAKDLGVRYAEALTGFKNIAAAMRRLEDEEGLRGLMGYEEALGYAVSAEVADKDGISAGLMLAEMAAVAKSEGRTLVDVLEAIHRAHGLFVGRSRSLVLEGSDGAKKIAAMMARLRGVEPEALSAAGIAESWDLESGRRMSTGPGGQAWMDGSLRGDVLIFELEGGGRVAVRPSGTEPKLKFYLETEAPWPAEQSHEAARRAAEQQLESVESAVLGLAGAPAS